MTDPALSVDTKLGRLYQKPDGGYKKVLKTSVAYNGLEDGTLVPSITNVIGAASGDFSGWQKAMFWNAKKAGASVYDAMNAADAARDFAAARGTAVHDCIDNMMSGGSQDVNDYPLIAEYKAEQYVEAYKAFRKEYWMYEPVASEITVYGETPSGQGYAGTVDAVFASETDIIVVDWKCSTSLRNSVALQLAAAMNAHSMHKDGKLVPSIINEEKISTEEYRAVYPDRLEIEIRGIGVQLCPDGTFNDAEIECGNAWDIFDALRKVWEFKSYPDWMLHKLHQ